MQVIESRLPKFYENFQKFQLVIIESYYTFLHIIVDNTFRVYCFVLLMMQSSIITHVIFCSIMF